MNASGDDPVTRHFEERSAWWDRIYREPSLEARILLRRQQVALSWVDALGFPEGSRVLEIGCGAGAATVALAGRGHLVVALDRSPAMVRRTRGRSTEVGVEQLVLPVVGDAHRLGFPDDAFDLVIALGVLSWLREPGAAIGEMTRVTRPGGHVLVTSLNSLDVARLLDPRRSPLSWPAKRVLRLAASALGRPPHNRVRPTRYPAWSVRWRLRRSRLLLIRQATVGFGPFTFLGRRLLSGDRSVRVHEVLQRLAEGDCKLVRWSGRLLLVLARRPEPA
jgi:ubiquinone/menaquinone biosynthesis C-methylase UbiE